MGEFNSQNKPVDSPAIEELGVKIENMNSYLVEGRAELDRLEEKRKDLDKQIADLEEQFAASSVDVDQLNEKVADLRAVRVELDEKISQAKNDLLLEETKLEEVRAQRVEEEARLEEVKLDIEKRLEDVKQRESAVRVYAAGLEEKEKKLDEYAEKMERFVGGLKKLK